MQEQQREAPELLKHAVDEIRRHAPRLAVTSKALEGVPHEVIVREAEDWEADLIVLGSHGYGRVGRALLGSVAAAVAVEAPCAVESADVRPPVAHSMRTSYRTSIALMPGRGKPRGDRRRASETGGGGAFEGRQHVILWFHCRILTRFAQSVLSAAWVGVRGGQDVLDFENHTKAA